MPSGLPTWLLTHRGPRPLGGDWREAWAHEACPGRAGGSGLEAAWHPVASLPRSRMGSAGVESAVQAPGDPEVGTARYSHCLGLRGCPQGSGPGTLTIRCCRPC